jgi:hypothetical protein
MLCANEIENQLGIVYNLYDDLPNSRIETDVK